MLKHVLIFEPWLKIFSINWNKVADSIQWMKMFAGKKEEHNNSMHKKYTFYRGLISSNKRTIGVLIHLPRVNFTTIISLLKLTKNFSKNVTSCHSNRFQYNVIRRLIMRLLSRTSFVCLTSLDYAKEINHRLNYKW